MQMEINVKQSLTIKLTQEMQQSLQFLQMSAMELQSTLAERVSENPLLNIEYQDHPIDGKNIEKMALLKNQYNATTNVKPEHEDYLHSKRAVYGGIEDVEKYLLEQIPSLFLLSEIEEKLLLFYIRNLNESGYLDISVEAAAERFGVTEDSAEEVLKLLQTFEPAGIGARNLKECLLIQIAKTHPKCSLPYVIIEQYFDELAQGALKKIAECCKSSRPEVQEAVDFIKSLKPKPLQEAACGIVEYVVPDILVNEVGGDWVVSVNRRHIPVISINDYYAQMIKECDHETKAYLKANLKDASILIQGLEQRDRTLYRLAKLLIEVQPDFFAKGITALKPMRLKDVAELLDVHESTISRAVNSKYIQTPLGVFKLQTLFAKGFVNTEGNTESTSHIKAKLIEIIKSENNQKPYSDQKLVTLLKQENIHISRRTVAKYREELLISNSAKRIRYS